MSKMKKGLSLVLVSALLLGMIILPTNIVQATETNESVAEGEENEDSVYREVTFSDFGILDQTILSGHQPNGALSGVETLDGVAFTGKLQMGLQADMYHSVRIGGKDGDANANWSGVGLWTEHGTQLSVNYYTGVISTHSTAGNIVKIPIADYGITYDEENGYSEFKYRVTFDYVEDTADIRITISVNDMLAYDGILPDAQNYFGNRLHLWANGGKTITVQSVEAEPVIYRDITFADFGIADQTAEIGIQPKGSLGSATNLDGVAFNGYITLGHVDPNIAQSFRIGGTDAVPYTGVGMFANSGSDIAIYHYSTDVSGTRLGSFDPAKYGVTFTEGEGFSEFLLRMTFDYISGTSDVKLNIYVNGCHVFAGVLAGAADTLGNCFFAWPINAPITLRSVEADEYFENETVVSKYFDSYFSTDSVAGGFATGSLTDYWTVSDGVITRKENSSASDTGNMAMLVLNDRSYKNFELTLSYYQASGAKESLILGVGASEKGKFFGEEAGNFGIAVTDRNLWNNLIKLDSDAHFTEGWHTLTMTLTGRMLRVYIDGTNEVVAVALPVSYNGGYVYLAAGTNASSFKDFSITPLAYGIPDIGDANNDGKVNIADMVRMKKNLQSMEGADVNSQYVDFDNDNSYTQDDFLASRQYLLGKEVKKTVTNGFAWGQDVMPIGGYYGPTEEHITDEFFQALQEMGLNVITTTTDYCDYYSSPENCLNALALGDKYGIYTFVRDSYFNFKTHMTEDEIRNRLQIYEDYKYFAGIRLIDEPFTDEYMPYGEGTADRNLSNYARMAALLNRVSGVAGYINLFPYYSSIPNVTWEGYESYVQEYMQSIDQQKLISYDHYVFDNDDKSEYFKNMSLIRDAAQEENIPFWAFVQAGRSVSGGNDPSEQQFYWNVNTCLAMGAKGIQYYPMLQPDTNVANGLIYADGTKSVYYDYAKTINQQIANMDHILMNCTHGGIIAVDTLAVNDTVDVSSRLNSTSFRELTGVSTNLGLGAIIGCFDYNGKTALYVVNNSTYLSQTIDLTFSSAVDLTQYADNTQSLGTSQSHSISLKPGAAVLLVVE